MSALAPPTVGRWRQISASTGEWLIVLAGFAAMYVPLYWWAAEGIWQSEDHGHGAIVLAVAAWLFWTLRHPIDAAPHRPAVVPGIALLVCGNWMLHTLVDFTVNLFEGIPSLLG